MTTKVEAGVRLLFEILSAVFVIGALLTSIYSDRLLLRAIAGVLLIVVVSAMTASVMLRMERHDRALRDGDDPGR